MARSVRLVEAGVTALPDGEFAGSLTAIGDAETAAAPCVDTTTAVELGVPLVPPPSWSVPVELTIAIGPIGVVIADEVLPPVDRPILVEVTDVLLAVSKMPSATRSPFAPLALMAIVS